MKKELKLLQSITKELTALYVEDEVALQQGVSEYLKKLFKRVECAVDGKEGLEKYKKEKYDIVITDIEMPIMNGLEMAKAIKDIDSNQSIIIMSAYTNTSYFVDSIQIGVSGYIIKPMDYKQMNQVIYKTVLNIQDHQKVIDYEKHLEDRVNEEVLKNKINQKILFEQSKMASMGEMLESIAHQWRQPLSVISTAASGMKMQKEYAILTDEVFNNSIDSIVGAAIHLSDTIDDFRDFFKPGKKKELYSLKESFHRATDLLSSKFKNRGIEVIENMDDTKIYGLSNDLVQVFMNILNNAKDALEESSTTRRLIFIDIELKDDSILISIKDNAGGVPELLMEKIFESHFTTKADKDGTGIGLYMTKQIISDHLNGKISVENIEYKYENETYNGAVFKIVLPLTNLELS
ncbi:MAG: response regulator [Campylobacterota bacterium]|nr:response regulator [Campylobacterota bacterium]